MCIGVHLQVCRDILHILLATFHNLQYLQFSIYWKSEIARSL